jgi:hypothetical protein
MRVFGRRYRKNPCCLSSWFDDCLWVVNISTGDYYRFNKEAAWVWDNLDKKTAFVLLERDLIDIYGLSSEAAMKSVESLVSKMMSANLVEVA